MRKETKRKSSPPPILSRLNYDLLYDMMHGICKYTGDCFKIGKLSTTVGVKGRTLSRYTSHLLNCGAITIFWEIGCCSEGKLKVYQRHFQEKDIEWFLDIMLLNYEDGKQKN